MGRPSQSIAEAQSEKNSYRSIRPFIRIHRKFNENPIRAYQKTDDSQSESNEDPIRAFQKTEILNQNLMKIPPAACQKTEVSIRIQWGSHESPSEKRGFAITFSEALGVGPDF